MESLAWQPTNTAALPLAYGYEGTPHSVVPAMIQLAGITSDDVVYEPGSGERAIVIAAIRPERGRVSAWTSTRTSRRWPTPRSKAAGVEDKIEIRWGNALDIDMSEATVVFLFMGEAFNLVMRPMLWKQLAVGARVVSNDFPMGDWKPDETLRVDTPDRSYVLYRWTITQEIKKQSRSRAVEEPRGGLFPRSLELITVPRLPLGGAANRPGGPMEPWLTFMFRSKGGDIAG